MSLVTMKMLPPKLFLKLLFLFIFYLFIYFFPNVMAAIAVYLLGDR